MPDLKSLAGPVCRPVAQVDDPWRKCAYRHPRRFARRASHHAPAGNLPSSSTPHHRFGQNPCNESRSRACRFPSRAQADPHSLVLRLVGPLPLGPPQLSGVLEHLFRRQYRRKSERRPVPRQPEGWRCGRVTGCLPECAATSWWRSARCGIANSDTAARAARSRVAGRNRARQPMDRLPRW